MLTPLTLVAKPTFYSSEADEREELLDAIDDMQPDVLVVDLPRGMQAPAHLWYLQDFCNQVRDLGFTVDWREQRVNGQKRVLVVGQSLARGRRPSFCRDDIGATILANQ